MPTSSRSGGIDIAEFERVVAIAGRAPSVHNTQPWRFRLADRFTIELELAGDAVLPHVDPTGREAVISCGAALHNLQVALHSLGLRGEITYLPDTERPLVLAVVATKPAFAMTRITQGALAAVYRRHTHRNGFDAPVEDRQFLTALSEAAAIEACALTWVLDSTARSSIVGIAQAATEREHKNPEVFAETAGAMNPVNGMRTGLPHWALAPRRPEHDPDHLPDGLPDRFVNDRTLATTPAVPGALAVVVTPGDGVMDWLAAGQGLQRVLLRAAERWAFANFATTALETGFLREAIRSVLDTADYPQIMFELGYSHDASSTGRLETSRLITA